MNYIEAANSTNTDVFHEGMKMGTVIELLHQLIDIGTALDAVKKYQFYGRKTEETQDIERYQNHMAISYNPDAEVNPWIEEVDFAALLPGRERTDAIRLYHAIIGGITESVEMAQALLTAIQDGKPLDEVNLLEETGDGMWYIAALLRVLGKTFEDAQRANVAKLNKRYPNGSFDAFLAQQENRDLDAERKVLEGDIPEGYRLPETDGEGHIIEVCSPNGYVRLAPGERKDRLAELRASPVVQAMSLDEQSEVLSNARAQLDRA